MALYRTSLAFFPFLAPSDFAGYVPQETIKQMQAEVKAAEQAVKRLFLDRCKRTGVRFEWRGKVGSPIDSVSIIGRSADLLVMGQPDPDQASPATDVLYGLILAAGRPVLILPHVGDFQHFGKRILLAWNGSREATRATYDALPLLKRAETVTVFSVDPPEGQRIAGTDITTHLARHGVNATTANTVAEDTGVGDVILSAVARSADMLVMGAWGHSRLRELVFGGATRQVLRKMTVPILMSH